jgi:uncharacterized protein YjbI with pentapeptide repeats
LSAFIAPNSTAFQTTLDGANLNNANFTDANLTGISAVNTFLEFTNFTGATLIDARLKGANFTDADVTNATVLINLSKST